MDFWNYCPKCGKRLVPNEGFCNACGTKTISIDSDEVFIFKPPIHNIGFFDLKIDFSPHIVSKADFNYDICACGYVNHIDNEFCYHCGVKRIESRLKRIFRDKERPKFDLDEFVRETTIVCECGAVNDEDSEYCDMCGRRLHEDSDFDENYSNFNLEYENPIFCFCGEENEDNSQFCRNCGVPLDSYGKIEDIKKLCVCSCLNESTADFCIECGNNLNEETIEIICVCGKRNPFSARFCSSCERPLNSQRILKNRLVCSCGKIMDYDSEYCPNCGKNIRKIMNRKKNISNTVKSVKGIWRSI